MNLEKVLEIMRENAVKIAIIQRDDGSLDVYNDKGDVIVEAGEPDSTLIYASSLSDSYLYCHGRVCSLFGNDSLEYVFEVE